MGDGEKNAKSGKTLAASLASELRALDTPPEVPGGTPMSKVGDAADAVQMGATKVQMLFAGGNGVPTDSAESMLKEFHMNVVTFVAYVQSAMGTQGKTFDAGLKSAAVALSNTCGNFAIVATATAKPSDMLKPSLGGVWEAVKAIKKLPKDGRTAISKALLHSASFLKDVSAELAELGESSQDGGDGGDDGDDGDDKAPRDEDDFRFDDDDFDDEEMRVAKQCAAFAAAAFQFMRDLVAPIVRGSASDVEALEKVLDACKGFQLDVEEVGAGVYPPQDVSQMATHAGKAMDNAREMGAGVAEAGGVEGAEAAVAKLEGAYAELREVLLTARGGGGATTEADDA